MKLHTILGMFRARFYLEIYMILHMISHTNMNSVSSDSWCMHLHTLNNGYLVGISAQFPLQTSLANLLI